MNVKNLLKWSGSEFPRLNDVLEKAGYRTAWGDTYGIGEVRRALIDGQPVFSDVGGKAALFVGERDGAMSVAEPGIDGEPVFRVVKDADLKRSWTGKVVIVQDEPGACPCDTEWVIYTGADTWPAEMAGIKEKGKAQIEAVNDLGPCMLPPHPVIVQFDNPGKREEKEKIRSMVVGAQIVIYDHSDIVSEFLHELGHVYWKTRLVREEMDTLADMHAGLKRRFADTKSLPAIFVDKWGWHDAEEMFCTMYLWYLKGRIIHEGYGKIFYEQFRDGYTFLEGVFDRVRAEIRASRDWPEAEKQLYQWVRKTFGKPNIMKIMGGGTMKAQITERVRRPSHVMIPREIKKAVLHTYRNLRWVEIGEGLLKGETIVVDGAGAVDLDYIEANRDRYHIVPVHEVYMAKGEERRRTAHRDIRKLLHDK